MSTYGAGIAFFLPLSTKRFFLPWQPIAGGVGAHTSFALKVAGVFGREGLWIWVPSVVLVLVVRRWRRQGTLAVAEPQVQ
jgi:hypothetical protein